MHGEVWRPRIHCRIEDKKISGENAQNRCDKRWPLSEQKRSKEMRRYMTIAQKPLARCNRDRDRDRDEIFISEFISLSTRAISRKRWLAAVFWWRHVVLRLDLSLLHVLLQRGGPPERAGSLGQSSSSWLVKSVLEAKIASDYKATLTLDFCGRVQILL